MVRACPARAPCTALVTYYLGQQVEEARAGSDWARVSSHPCWPVSGRDACISLGTGTLERAEKQRQPELGLGEQVAKGGSTCSAPQKDYVHLSRDKT